MAGENGRPPVYDNPSDLQQEIDEYFTAVQEKGDIHPTITGLCYAVGFASRQSFYDYEKREGFSYTIKRARLRIEQYYEQCLTGQYSSGPIFALKNMGWSDRQEIDHTTGGEKINTPNISALPIEKRRKIREIIEGEAD